MVLPPAHLGLTCGGRSPLNLLHILGLIPAFPHVYSYSPAAAVRFHLHEKPGTEPGTTAREEESISLSPVSHINGIITEIDKKG